MYKGSVDVQELDLQSLMHTASELEIRGLAYEARDNAAQMLNVNLEYPSYTQTPVPAQSTTFPQARTDVERLKQVSFFVLLLYLVCCFSKISFQSPNSNLSYQLLICYVIIQFTICDNKIICLVS